MTLSFAEHLDLLEQHGRAAVHSLGQLTPDDQLPPTALSARATAEDHWSTLECWAWILENPSADFSEYPERKPPDEYLDLVAAIPTELDRLARSLSSSGPDAPIEYFDRPGTVAEVARLLAREAMVAAHSAGLAAGGTTLSLTPSAAVDAIDHALRDWESEDASLKGKENVVKILCTDTGDDWHLALKGEDSFRLVRSAEAAVVVTGVAQELLWWLHGYAAPEGSVTLSGDRGTIHDLWVKLLLAGDEPPKGRRWFW